MAQGRMAGHHSVSGLLIQLQYMYMQHFTGLIEKKLQDAFSDNDMLALLFTNVVVLVIHFSN